MKRVAPAATLGGIVVDEGRSLPLATAIAFETIAALMLRTAPAFFAPNAILCPAPARRHARSRIEAKVRRAAW
jgi:hypothetical protein